MAPRRRERSDAPPDTGDVSGADASPDTGADASAPSDTAATALESPADAGSTDSGDEPDE